MLDCIEITNQYHRSTQSTCAQKYKRTQVFRLDSFYIVILFMLVIFITYKNKPCFSSVDYSGVITALPFNSPFPFFHKLCQYLQTEKIPLHFELVLFLPSE